MVRFGRRSALIGALLGSALVVAFPAVAAANIPDADISVRDGDTGDAANTVCEFYLHVTADQDEDGHWEIWKADGSERVDSGEYSVTADSDDRIPDEGTMSLSDGDYQVRWDDEPVDDSHKQNNFTVDCEEPSEEPTGSVEQETATPAPIVTAPPTLPPTDALGDGTRPDPGFGLAFIVLAMSAGLVIFARPLAELARRR